jgi:polyferredoxin
MAKLQFLPAVLALNVGVIVFLVLLTLVFGRIYCSVICPLGVFQDAVSHLGTRKSKRPYKFKKEIKWLRYGVWALFVIALVAGVQVFVALLAPYSAYGRMVQNLLQPLYLWGNNLLAWFAERSGSYAFYQKEVWLRSLPTFIVAAVTLAVIVVLSFKGGRTYCNSICPVGTTLSFFSRFAMFRPMIDADQCVRCKTCEVNCKAQCISITKEAVFIDHSRCVDCFNCIDTCPKGGLKYRFAWKKKAAERKAETLSGQASGRRAFMTGTALAVGAAALKGVEARAQEAGKKVDGGFADVLPKQAPRRETPVTPPGSTSVKDFYRHCTGCQLCVAECPNNVLRPSGKLEHLMQPEMSFEKGFCRPECTRCSELCPAGAIRKVSREEKTEYHVGTAGVNRESCLSATGKSACGKCAQICPTGAIQMVRDQESGRLVPVVAEEVCIGCGACEHLCPVRPVSAITVNGREQHI